MGFFDKLKAGLQKTQSKLTHEIKRIVTRSPRLDGAAIEELEASLIAADLGMPMTTRIVDAVRRATVRRRDGRSHRSRRRGRAAR